MTKDDKIRLVQEKIAAIPASGGGYMELYPATLSSKLSRDLLELIAKTAVETLETAK